MVTCRLVLISGMKLITELHGVDMVGRDSEFQLCETLFLLCETLWFLFEMYERFCHLANMPHFQCLENYCVQRFSIEINL